MNPEEMDEGDERTTAYVMEVLSEDLDKAFQRLSKDFGNRDENGLVSFDEADAREFVRAAFAEIEGTSFCLRVWCAQHLLDAGRMSERERLVVSEVTLDLRDGKVVEKPAKLRLEENVKFTFALLDRVHRIEKPTLDTSEKWWSDFKTAIRIRHRLTHPRMPADLDVSSDELMTVVSAEGGFRQLAFGYPEPRFADAERMPSPDRIE
jgi:hypothetical protein